MIKNTANQQITFGAIALTDGLPITTGTPVVYLSKDNAAQAASTNTAAHVGHGLWRLDLTQTETDANHLGGVMVLANAVNAFAQAFPLTLADFKSDATAANQTSISNAIAALKDFDSASDVVAHVTLVDTTTTLTNHTSGDATIANQTAISNAIAALNDFNASSDAVANVTLVATCTTNTDQRGTDNANLVAPDNAGITSNGNAIAALVAPDNAGITSNGLWRASAAFDQHEQRDTSNGKQSRCGRRPRVSDRRDRCGRYCSRRGNGNPNGSSTRWSDLHSHQSSIGHDASNN